MAKLTLLEIVQDILNDMTSDDVNSIDDTIESEQVASIVKSTYLNMMSNRNWPHMRKTLNLTPSGNNDLPTHMYIEDDLKELISVYYNKIKSGETRLRYNKIEYLEPDDFLVYTNKRNNDNSNVEVVNDPTGVEFLIINDKGPDYFTSFDDETLVFDSYDSDVDNTLQASKTQARGYIIPSFSSTDTFIPDLPEEAFPALVEEAKSRAALKLNQMEDVKSEQESRRQNRWLSRKAWRAHEKNIYPNNYGRAHNRYRRRDATFRDNR